MVQDGLPPVSGALGGTAEASLHLLSPSRRLIQACRHGGGAGAGLELPATREGKQKSQASAETGKYAETYLLVSHWPKQISWPSPEPGMGK